MDLMTGEETVRALDPVRDLVASDEAEIAVDHLINTVDSFRLTLRQDEHDRLMSAAARLNVAQVELLAHKEV
ncbi:hypothetical protein AQJ27_05765 [Streptomyces olivochromogenes]|uniref:Uncharacterized protein n=2 Tax=Streptomyces olivochromogenes TaxID=1963 RepID=A0A250V3N2_STROL|nr:hypothetical protein AQJ27_05765 [Streptomyces olivochromogenes]GAX48560.1 hypothetical protein SO3561_00040 [Streptomyces olivochromogenes]